MSGEGTDGLAARDHLMADKVDAVYLLFVEIRSLSSSCHLSKIYFIFQPSYGEKKPNKIHSEAWHSWYLGLCHVSSKVNVTVSKA